MTLLALNSSDIIPFLTLNYNYSDTFSTVCDMFNKGSTLLKQVCLPSYFKNFKSSWIAEKSSLIWITAFSISVMC